MSPDALGGRSQLVGRRLLVFVSPAPELAPPRRRADRYQ
jgi:hypothetical protein